MMQKVANRSLWSHHEAYPATIGQPPPSNKGPNRQLSGTRAEPGSQSVLRSKGADLGCGKAARIRQLRTRDTPNGPALRPIPRQSAAVLSFRLKARHFSATFIQKA